MVGGGDAGSWSSSSAIVLGAVFPDVEARHCRVTVSGCFQAPFPDHDDNGRDLRPIYQSSMSSCASSTRSVRVSTVLHAVDQNDPVGFENLVDGAVVATSRGSEILEFTNERLPEPVRVVSDRPEDGLQSSISYLLGEPVEMMETLRRDPNFVHSSASNVVLEPQPLALFRVSSRPPKRLHEFIVSEDVKGFFEGLKVVRAHQDERGPTVASDQDAVVLALDSVGQLREVGLDFGERNHVAHLLTV